MTRAVGGRESSLLVSELVEVGTSGTGTLRVEDGGLVSSADGYIGVLPTATGLVSIGSPRGEAAAAPGELKASRIVFGDGSGALVAATGVCQR